MCGGLGGGGGGAGKIQKRTEELERQRQERIRAGARRIDEAFSRFDDDFFNDFRDRFIGFAEPQITKQFDDARGRATAALIDRGILESTEGTRALTDLQDRDALERTNLANQALDEVNKLKAGISNEKSNLFSLNEVAADPERVNNLASGAAASFTAPNAFNPVGDVFGSVLSNIAAFQAARNNALAPFSRPTFSTGTGVSSSPAGSGRVVR